ncbi:ChaN family lipoprotein [Janthinobacterium sp. HLX7-2]|uniref:ChaN family lipoprotein n=1 Tax=Janthinobacterium sp. HLX7-2 TaxID=1259331 RepID=UPI003F1E89F1
MKTVIQRTSMRAALLCSVLALAACGSLLKKEAPPPSAPVADTLPNPQVLLLGEVHDNAQGHRLRMAELQRRVAAGWRPVIVMEQFDRENQALLTRAARECADPDCIIRVMEQPRWDWSLYRPVLDLAISYQLPLIAANLSPVDASRIVRDGIKWSMPQAMLGTYLATPVPADILEGQKKEIQESRCNMLPDMMLDGIVNAQVARDIWMAKLIRDQAPRDVVLLAGNDHVRKDIGVPRWLKLADPQLNVRSIGYLEQGGSSYRGAFDLTQTMAPQLRPDPCAKFK